MQEVSGFVIVRNPEDNARFDVVAIGIADERGEHDVLYYVENAVSVEFEDAVEIMETWNKKIGAETNAE